MKKYGIVLLTVLVLWTGLLSGCGSTGGAKKEEEKIDYSKYSFTDASWTRQAEHDEEKIRFGSDGSFSYSCACGNPVNDADLCEGYTYDDETKTITLNCIEITDEMVTTIKIVSCDENSLHLDFDGEIRIFEK